MSANTERLLIAPDGELFFVPFAALRTPDAVSSAGSALVERAETVLVPTLLRWAEQDSSAALDVSKATVAVIADPVFNAADPRVPQASPMRLVRSAAADSLARLPATVDEARAVGGSFPGRVTVLSGTQATRDAVLSSMRRGVTIAHFATHSVIRASNPGLSYLALSAYDGTWKPTPSRLYASDILDSGVRADLVVLSACRSAAGEIIPGEGPMGLSYGFLANGSRAVIAAAWPVPDAFAAQFMQSFYAALVGGKRTPSAALREAQLQAKRSVLWSDPYYWASFSIVTTNHG